MQLPAAIDCNSAEFQALCARARAGEFWMWALDVHRPYNGRKRYTAHLLPTQPTPPQQDDLFQ